LTVQLFASFGAERELEDERFCNAWQSLYEQCPWGTTFQSPQYAATWYRVYHERFEPLLVTGRSHDGELVGLLAAARSRRDGRVTLAGDHQAEYRVWLAHAWRSDEFIARALEELAPRLQRRPLSFTYLPPGTPTTWIEREPSLRSRCVLNRHTRPTVSLADSAALEDYLKQRMKKWRRQTRRQWLDRLERDGEPRLVHLDTAEKLEAFFDCMIAHYDLKHAAAHDSMPFHEDPCKKSFHQALLQVPGLSHATALVQKDTPLAMNFGIGDKGTLYPLLAMYSLWHAKLSPFRLNLLHLFEQLAKEGWQTVDLTPGPDSWKEQFATAYDEVFDLTFYPSARRERASRIGGQVARLAKSAVTRCLGPTATAACGREFAGFQAGQGPQMVRRMGIRIAQNIWSRREVRVYRATVAPPAAAGLSLRHNQIADFLRFDPQDFDEDRRRTLSSLFQVVERDGHVYTHVDQGRLLAFGWWSEPFDGVFLDDLPPPNLPDGAVVFGSISSARRSPRAERIRALLARMLTDALGTAGVRCACLCVPAGDRVLRDVVEQLGFSHESSCYSQTRWFRKQAWHESSSAPVELPRAGVESECRGHA
jgi:CelD/BcsL family acetyltransferase involved in cellulose biosynthesis